MVVLVERRFRQSQLCRAIPVDGLVKAEPVEHEHARMGDVTQRSLGGGSCAGLLLNADESNRDPQGHGQG